MWRGFPREYAEERAMLIARKAAPGLRPVIRETGLAGLEWVVRLWLFDAAAGDPREAVVRVRATDGEPLGFETEA